MAVGAALLVSLMAANALNIAALVAVGSGMTLLHAGPIRLLVLVGGVVVSGLVILGSFDCIARVVTLLCLALLVAVAVPTGHPPHSCCTGCWYPHGVQRQPPDPAGGSTGTTISPYLFVSRSAHRVEDLRNEPACGRKAVPLDKRPPGQPRRKLHAARLDVLVGMLFSNLVMCAIIVATASTLRPYGHHDLDGVADAAKALEPAAGRWAGALFALGFIGSGMLALPVLAGSGVAGLLGKRSGLPRQAPVFYGMVVLGIIGAAVALIHVDPVQFFVISAFINGVTAASFLVLVMLVSGNRKLMGDHVNARLASTLG